MNFRLNRTATLVAHAMACLALTACGGGKDGTTADDGAEALQAADEQAEAQQADGTKSALATTSTSTATWKYLTREGLSFTVKGTQTVRYGLNSSWITKSVTSQGACTNAFFGGDPLVGTGKRCELLVSGTVSAPLQGECGRCLRPI